MYKKVVKQLFDFIFSLVLSVIGFIPMLVIAVLIKIDSKGPVLFRQVRFGKGSSAFVIFKFRTMKIGTPEVANQDFTDIDSYVTKIGKFLRKTSLDELPQLFNIIRGDMSFIGPRPLAKSDESVIEMRKKTGGDLVTPGITGYAQVNGRNSINDVEKAEYDAYYAEHLTFFMDFLIFVKTIVAVIGRKDINKEY
ncbi:sugar transferase [Weissella confusa]|uniref:sugar transferase n=1 Tax=Weissella confusa TaxID=1583 RepID=UPI0022E0E3F3|nr:sugar transferase [Weissella confusa]